MDQCPVCKAEAEEVERGFFDGTAVKCPAHGWFEYSDTVQVSRSNEPREAWERALTKARNRAQRTGKHETVAGKRPRIVDHDFL
jgi:hypothetical protein